MVTLRNSKKLNERLLSALIGLARATEGNEEQITEELGNVLWQGLSLVINNSDSVAGTDCKNAHQLTELLAIIREEKKRLVPNCFDCASPCGRTADYDMQEFWDAEEEQVQLKLELVKRLAEQAKKFRGYQKGQGNSGAEILDVCLEALIVLGWNGSKESLLRVMKKVTS